MHNYNWNAADYAQHSQAQQLWARELIGKLALAGSEAVLDLGCGDGKVTAELARCVTQGYVLGVDSSAAMIDLASHCYPVSQYPNLSFAQMDARRLDFAERFDVVFSNAALHWVKDHQPVIEGIYRSLKPGGRILLQMGGKGNAGVILSVLEQVISEPAWHPYFKDFASPYGFYGTDEYDALLPSAGFNVTRLQLIPKDMQHAGQGGLEGWIHTTWLPYTETIPAALRDEFISAIASRYLENIPLDGDGIAHVAMVRLEVEALRPE